MLRNESVRKSSSGFVRVCFCVFAFRTHFIVDQKKHARNQSAVIYFRQHNNKTAGQHCATVILCSVAREPIYVWTYIICSTAVLKSECHQSQNPGNVYFILDHHQGNVPCRHLVKRVRHCHCFRNTILPIVNYNNAHTAISTTT